MTIYFCSATNGFYDTRINNVIPDGSIEITKQLHDQLLTGQAKGKNIIADKNGFPSLAEFSITTDQLLEAKQAEIVQKFKAAMAPITGIYTDEDIASFPTQEAEAKAYQADSNSPTPFIDGLLANRPTVDKATLVQRIIANANTYKAVAGPAIGRKQHYEDQLYALKAQHEDPEQPDVTKADIDAIVVDYL